MRRTNALGLHGWRPLYDRFCDRADEIMPGLGHFPMSEAPERFLGYLKPVLSQIASGDK